MLQKIQRISIPEGGRGRGFTTGKLETALQGGGSCFWVPESAVKTGRLYVHKNGVHRLGEDYYGAGEVVVNVNSYASNGDRMIIPIDDILTDQNDLPRSIRIETPPDKLEYADGERIDLTGIVVKAYKGNGEVWTSQDYPDGVIPVEKLICNPKTVHADEDVPGAIYGGDGINAIKLNYIQQLMKSDISGRPPTMEYIGDVVLGYRDGDPVTAWAGRVDNKGPATLLLTRYNGGIYTARIKGTADRFQYCRYTGTMWTGAGSSTATTRWFTWDSGAWSEYFTEVPESDVNPINQAVSVKLQKLPITIGWPRPLDNYRLEDEFYVDIYEKTAPSGHSGSSHSSQPTGGN